MKSKPTVVGTGLLALDYIINAKGNDSAHIWAGGTCGNVLTILSHFGWESFPISRLNEDDTSDYIRRDLQRWGVRLDFTQVGTPSETPVFVQENKRTQCGHVTHSFSRNCPACEALLPSYEPIETSAVKSVVESIPASDIFFMDRVSKAALMLAKQCANKGALVVYEPSVRSDPDLEFEALKLAHIVKYSNERFENYIDEFNTNILLEIKTEGKNGLRFRSNLINTTDNDWKHVSSIQVGEFVDAAGAGDWCTAGLISKVGVGGFERFASITQTELIEALLFGQELSAWNCGFEGARGGMYRVGRRPYDSPFSEAKYWKQCFSSKTIICSSCQLSVTA